MTTTAYPPMRVQIGRFTVPVERADHSTKQNCVLWRAECAGEFCFGGFVEKGTPDDIFRKMVVRSVVEQASEMADFANECVRIRRGV